MTRQIALLTDFGLRDAYVGVMKAVMLERNSAARLIDLCHDVPPQDIRRGAFLLATSVPYFAPGTVFLVVVDPGVGTDRRPIALEVADWQIVGPDNGVMAWALRFLSHDGHASLEVSRNRLRLREGARAVQLTERRHWRPEASSTFHGRDIFAPVAAELSLGRPLADFGPAAADLEDLPWPEPRRTENGELRGEVLTVDGYGNLITNLRADDLPSRPTFKIVAHLASGLAAHFQSSDELVALIGSNGFVELAAPNGSARDLTGAAVGAAVTVRGESI